MKRIPYGRQYISEDDLRVVEAALKSDYITTGPRVEEFEKEFASYVETDWALAVSNGTAALHLSALALNDHPGKRVITSPITFLASANCIIYSGKEVDFADIDPETYLIDFNRVEDMLRKSPPDTYAGIIPVDFAGYPVNTEELGTLAKRYNLFVIEDACHAPGGWFTNQSGERVLCGSGRYIDMAIFSFHPVKHITSGEGGMITTKNRFLFNKITDLRSHGTTKDPDKMIENHGGWYYEMQQLGYNYRLTDFQAALANSQLKRSENNISIRQEIAGKYNLAFASIPEITRPFVAPGIFHAYHLYVIKYGNRKGLYDHLVKNNIFVQVHYIPVHLQPYYKNLGWKRGDFPVAESYYEECLSLPLYPTLQPEEQDYVIEKIVEFVKR